VFQQLVRAFPSFRFWRLVHGAILG
jgi:hypothetical protein